MKELIGIKGKIIYVDIDGTLCTITDGKYMSAKPYPSMIEFINRLYDNNLIILWTARGATTGIDWSKETKMQVDNWGIKYHDLKMGKPHYDYFICDKSLNPFVPDVK